MGGFGMLAESGRVDHPNHLREHGFGIFARLALSS
jgi:hypothetical protein